MHSCTSVSSRKMLQKVYWIAKIGVGTAANEPCRNCVSAVLRHWSYPSVVPDPCSCGSVVARSFLIWSHSFRVYRVQFFGRSVCSFSLFCLFGVHVVVFPGFFHFDSKSCRSRKMLKNEYLVAKLGIDTAENEPSEICGTGTCYMYLKKGL